MIALGAVLRRGFFGIHRLLSGAASLIGVVVIVIGLLYLGLAWGLWSGKGWAWVISLILAGLGIVVSLISLAGGGFGALFVLILDAIIMYYLLTPHVRTFFGEYRTKTSPQPSPQPIPPSAQSAGANRFCPNCGAPVQSNVKFCSHCGKPVA